jgi:hypothetical protein
VGGQDWLLTLLTGFGDPMDPKFDFEGYFENLAKENP